MSKKLTIEEMQEIAHSRGGECLSEEYFDCETKLTWKCNKGHVWKTTPTCIRVGYWCPACSGNKRNCIEEMQNIAKLRNGNCLSETYVNNKTPLLWECFKGHKWIARPDNVKHGSWCKKCKKSKGEVRIFNFLIDNNIKFEEQKIFNDCKSIRNSLPFDFYLTDYNILIEYDGEQHFKPVNFGHSKNNPIQKRFNDLIKRDQIKNKYCEDNNISLIRIPYTEKDIETFLKEKLIFFLITIDN